MEKERIVLFVLLDSADFHREQDGVTRPKSVCMANPYGYTPLLKTIPLTFSRNRLEVLGQEQFPYIWHIMFFVRKPSIVQTISNTDSRRHSITAKRGENKG